MRLIKNILVATDFTKSSKNLIETAALLGQNFHADISIIHVLPGEIKEKKSKLMLEEAASTRMEKAVKSIESKGVTVKKTYLRKGNSADAVIRTADRLSMNLILIGSSEITKDDKFKLGTTAEKIIRKSEVPVWVVKKNSDVEIKSVFCPVDFSDESKRALTNAVYLAMTFKARLIIYSVYELYDKSFPRFDPKSGGLNKLAKTEHEKKLDKFMKAVKTAGLDHKVIVKGGDPATQIAKGINKLKPDLLIMGTTGKSGLSRWLMGSVTEKVTREVPCSFITVKSENILTLELQTRVTDMEYHYKAARELLEKGLFKESVDEFLVCLKINDMHIPSLVGISKAYERLGRKRLSESYRKMARSTLAKMWDDQIQTDVLKHYDL